MVLVRAARRLWRPRGAGGGASRLPDPELRRARAIILLGLALWAAIAVEIVALAEDDDDAPLVPPTPHHAVEPTTDVIDIRDTPLDPQLADEIALALDPHPAP